MAKISPKQQSMSATAYVFSALGLFQKKNVITSTIQGNALKKVFTTQSTSSSYSTLTLRRLNVRDIFLFEFVFFVAFLISLVADNLLSFMVPSSHFLKLNAQPLPCQSILIFLGEGLDTQTESQTLIKDL